MATSTGTNGSSTQTVTLTATESITVQKELFTKATFPGKLVMLGCGAIGQAAIPLVLRHTDMTPDRFKIVSADTKGKNIADQYGLEFIIDPLTPENFKTVLAKYVSEGDTLLNLSVNTSSSDFIEFCHKKKVYYVDTSKEVWPGTLDDPNLPVAARTNYSAREKLLALRDKYKGEITMVTSHGANPGLISHFVKQALLNIARDTIAKDTGMIVEVPKTREEWASLMQSLGVKVLHVAERDTQASQQIKDKDEFVNTWSIDGFIAELMQPVELGWGTHEKELPTDAHEHSEGSKASIYLDRPGGLTPVRSWTPREGSYHGLLITHDECISTSDYFTVRGEDGSVVYRPTMFYSYHPCDDATLSVRELAGNNWKEPKKKRIMFDEIERGSDELGVLVMGHKKRSYWFGSDLSIAQTREVVPFTNATSLQVAIGAVSALIWLLENPKRGLCEPEDLDFDRILEISMPYLGTVHGKYTNWSPLRDRKVPLFPEDTSTDPWQFKNFRVM